MNTFCRLFTRVLTIVAVLTFVAGEAAAQVPTSRFRVAHMITGVPLIDAYVNGGATPYLTDVPFESESALSARFPVALRLVITRADVAPTSPLIDRTMVLDADNIYSFIAYGTAAAPKFAALPRRLDQAAPPNFGIVRVFNATTLASGVDVYFDSTTGTPAMTNVAMDSVSLYSMMPAQSRSLIITPTGSKTPLARYVLPMGSGSIQTLIVTGSTGANLAVNAMNEATSLQTQEPMIALQREAAVGAVPTLRFINAFPQPDARRLDVYLNGATRAAQGINYRGASGVLAGVGVGETRVTLVPENRGSNDSVYGTTMTLARDTAYALVLTQFRSGMAVAMTLKRSLSEPAPTAGSAKVRVANVNDFEPGLRFELSGPGTLSISQPPFLTATQWAEVTAGVTTLRVFRGDEAVPMFEGQYTIPAGGFLTLMPIGDGTRFAVDVLVHSDQGEQNPMESFGPKEASVREQIAATTRATRLRSTPNPIVADARVSFELASAAIVSLELYDALGRNVRTIAEGQFSAGHNSVTMSTNGLPSGAYTCVLRMPTGVAAVGVVVQ